MRCRAFSPDIGPKGDCVAEVGHLAPRCARVSVRAAGSPAVERNRRHRFSSNDVIVGSFPSDVRFAEACDDEPHTAIA